MTVGALVESTFANIATVTTPAIITDKPMRGALAENGVILENNMTWAELVAVDASQASYKYATVYVSNWKTLFVSNGTRWIPLGKRLILASGPDPTGLTNSPADAHMDIETDAIPASLLSVGCIVKVKQAWYFDTATGIKQVRCGFAAANGNEFLNFQLTATTTVAARVEARFYVTAVSGAGSTYSMSSTANPGNASEGTGTTTNRVLTIDWGADQALYHGVRVATVDSDFYMYHRLVEVTFP